MSVNDFNHKYNLKNKATSNTKRQQILSTIPLRDIVIYLRDGPFESDIRIVNLHPTKGTHWVVYLNQKYFESYGCSPPQKLFKLIIKRSGYCLYSEYKTQVLKNKTDSFCAKFFL